MFCSLRFSPVRSLLLDLDPYCGNDSEGMFAVFHKQVARELAPTLAITFRHLDRGGNLD